MKKTPLLTAFLSLGLVLTGCNNSNNPSGDGGKGQYYEKDIKVKALTTLNAEKDGNVLTFKYSDGYFLNDAKKYDKGLSELSFGLALSCSTKEITTNFYSEAKFLDITPVEFDEAPTVDSCAYTLAHKTIGEYELFSITARWYDYQKEWANNFVIGKEGDHEGFSLRANEIYEKIQEYISAHQNNHKLKLWFSGYSRGGAIANVLSSLILRDDKISIEQSDMYVYTYEAPNALTSEHAVKYENIHNIVSSGDIITHFAPNEYGLYRCGVDHEIYDKDISTHIKQLDNTIPIPEFVECSGKNEEGEDVTLKNDVELVNYIFYDGLHKESSDETILANTREQYVDNYQSAISYCLSIAFSLSEETLNEIIDDVKSKSSMEIIMIFASGDSMFEYIKPYLDKDNVTYDEDILKEDLVKLRDFIITVFSSVVVIAMGDAKTNLSRLIDMHFPETVYVALLNSHK